MSLVGYEKHATGVSVGSAAIVVEVDRPEDSSLKKLVVKQTSGSLDGFSVTVYTNNNAANGSGTPELYKIFDSLTVAAGSDLAERYVDVPGYTIYDPDQASGQQPTKVWVRIEPAGTGDKNFSVAVGYGIPIG